MRGRWQGGRGGDNDVSVWPWLAGGGRPHLWSGLGEWWAACSRTSSGRCGGCSSGPPSCPLPPPVWRWPERDLVTWFRGRRPGAYDLAFGAERHKRGARRYRERRDLGLGNVGVGQGGGGGSHTTEEEDGGGRGDYKEERQLGRVLLVKGRGCRRSAPVRARSSPQASGDGEQKNSCHSVMR
jgi:hypothetical protein